MFNQWFFSNILADLFGLGLSYLKAAVNKFLGCSKGLSENVWENDHSNRLSNFGF